jgi:hypothetical protein
MKLKEIQFLMDLGMISVDDDNINYVVDALISGGFEVEK